MEVVWTCSSLKSSQRRCAGHTLRTAHLLIVAIFWALCMRNWRTLKRDIKNPKSSERRLLWDFMFPQRFLTKIFKQTAKLTGFYHEPPCTHHLGSTITILLYLLFHIYSHQSIPPSIHQTVYLWCVLKYVAYISTVPAKNFISIRVMRLDICVHVLFF